MKMFRRIAHVSVFIASRSLLRSNPGISLMTVSMMILIYLNLLFLPSLIQGAADLMDRQLIDTTTSNIAISPSGGATTITNPGSIVKDAVKQQYVSAATSANVVGTRVTSSNNTGSWAISAIEPSAYSQIFADDNRLIEGEYLANDDTDSIVLGVGIAGAEKTHTPTYASSLQTVHAGDTVTVTLVNGQKHDYKVKGIFSNKFQFSDVKGYITTKSAEALLPATKDVATSVYVRTTSSKYAATVIDSLKKLSFKDVKFQTSDDLAGPVKDQIATFKQIGNILKSVSLVVAAITIFIVTYVDLVNRRKQIGIERAIGIRAGTIVISYILKAIVYALIGISLGAVVFMQVVVPLIAKYPFDFPNGFVSLSPSIAEMRQDGAILIIVAILAALLPSWRSVRIKILDAIWGS